MEFGLSVVYFLSKLPEKLTLWKVWMLLDGTEVSILNVLFRNLSLGTEAP